ncbi:TPA: hypothetical protein N0F65_005012 [Lagenidium giganteum]|uniref:Kringle domain-containing protein n=1 Tax=Lagenidium giganteum TaxID=4803 RepID=A0AAV2ZKC8_9STRA|nr:TPA: hypothetical protein N0F65_005012 [Lagenidium giganteum]
MADQGGSGSGKRAPAEDDATVALVAPRASKGFLLQLACILLVLVAFVAVTSELNVNCAAREASTAVNKIWAHAKAEEDAAAKGVDITNTTSHHGATNDTASTTTTTTTTTSSSSSSSSSSASSSSTTSSTSSSSSASNATEKEAVADTCVARTIDAKTVEYHSKHRFYSLLQGLDPPFPPPVFSGANKYLCDEEEGYNERGWSYCLPISGRKDEPYCVVPDRMDLLTKQTPDTLCYGSVLHMLLLDVYDEIAALGGKPALLYGTMLGAIRNASTIPFTEDTDIGYQIPHGTYSMEELKKALWAKGYFLHKDNIMRVCIAPTHPLASNLYNPNKPGEGQGYLVPYVDMYYMEPLGDVWRVEETKHGRHIPNDKFEPYTKVRMNGMEFDTLADPIDFLKAEYGDNYMVPQPRGGRRTRR